MRLLADMHISPRTVGFLRGLGHDVVRVNEMMPATSTDEAIVRQALEDARVVLTQPERPTPGPIVRDEGAALPDVPFE